GRGRTIIDSLNSPRFFQYRLAIATDDAQLGRTFLQCQSERTADQTRSDDGDLLHEERFTFRVSRFTTVTQHTAKSLDPALLVKRETWNAKRFLTRSFARRPKQLSSVLASVSRIAAGRAFAPHQTMPSPDRDALRSAARRRRRQPKRGPSAEL